jgi:hypothetical protein
MADSHCKENIALLYKLKSHDMNILSRTHYFTGKKKKVNFALEHTTMAQKGSRGIVLLYLTSALDGGGWLTPCPGRFTPGKDTHYALYRRICGSQSQPGRVKKILSLTGFDSRTVQHVATRYTDYAIPVQ